MTSKPVPAFDPSKFKPPTKATTESIGSPECTSSQATEKAPETQSLPAITASPSSRVCTQIAQPVRYVTEFDRAAPLDPDSFPNAPSGDSKAPPTTASNVAYVLEKHGVAIRYNVIKKQPEISWNGQRGTTENLSSRSVSIVTSLMVKNKLSPNLLPQMLEVVADQNPYNPAAEWINGKPWDGTDRLEEFCRTLTESPDFAADLKKTLIHRWLISAVAAVVMPTGFHTRGILTLQGPQSIGKTSWIRGLVDDPTLQAQLIRLDHHLDAASKDSKLTAISHWIVEIGELDSSLRKDVARLKGFITSDQDKIRRPYARGDTEYPRRTVFCASVNDHAFLVDQTGNSRFWTIPVSAINYQHGIDMQQLFAQMAVDYRNSVSWWLSREEETLLERHNNNHRAVSIIRERLTAAIDLDTLPTKKVTKPYTASQALGHIGFDRPSNQQCKEAGGVLRELFGDPKKIQGNYKWHVPFRDFNSFGMNWNQPTPDADDLY